MRISADRQQKLFDAHADPINDLRVELMTRHRNGEVIEIDWLDHQLFKLPFKINERIKSALGVNDAE